jgi:hypothetical protein
MIKQAKPRITPELVVFDSWYSGAQPETAAQHGLHWLTQLK